MTRSTMYWLGNDGLFHAREADAVIPPPPPPPHAGPTAAPRLISQTNLTISVSGSASTAVAPAVLKSFLWNWGDGTTSTTSAATHTYTAAGQYTVSLTVQDNSGTSDDRNTATLSVVVTAPVTYGLPTASFTYSVSGLTVSVDASASTVDPALTASYAWNWGDGGADTGVTASHTFTTSGAKTVQLTVTDTNPSGAQRARQSQTITLAPVFAPPTAVLNTSSSGLSVTYDATGSSASDGTALTYDLDWGDGSAHASGPTGGHTYGGNGPWSLVLVVTDLRGATGTTTKTIAVSATGRDARKFPFSSSSPFNTAIGSNAVFGTTSDQAYKDFQAAGTHVNSNTYVVSVLTAKTTDPVVTLTDKGSDGSHTPEPIASASATSVSFVKVTPLYIPDNPKIEATLATPGGDTWTCIIQPNSSIAQEITGDVRQTGPGAWAAKHSSLTDILSDGLNQGRRASNTSNIGSLLRLEDIQQGAIKHALSCCLPGSSLGDGIAGGSKANKFVWPAFQVDGDWSTSYTGHVKMGTLWAIPPSVNITTLGLSSIGLMLAKALQDYGLYIMARGNKAILTTEFQVASYASQLNTAWTALAPKLLQVLNNTPTTIGGGGTPRQPPLPPATLG